MTEREFLKNYDPSKYPITMVTVDTVVLSPDLKRIVLVKRKGHPFMNCWALPGGFMDPDETAKEAAIREVQEEVGMTIESVEFAMVADSPHRDPRGRAVSLVHRAVSGDMPYAGDDAAQAEWFSVKFALEVPLAFDHLKIIRQVTGIDEPHGRGAERLSDVRPSVRKHYKLED